MDLEKQVQVIDFIRPVDDLDKILTKLLKESQERLQEQSKLEFENQIKNLLLLLNQIDQDQEN